MLKNTLFEIAFSTCFSSPLLAKELRRCMFDTETRLEKNEFYKTCLDILCKQMDEDFPRQFRQNDISAALKTVWQPGMVFGEKGGDISRIDDLVRNFFLEHGDYLQYRDGGVQDFARFAARLDPALLASWRFAQRILAKPTLEVHDVQRIISAQQPFFSPAVITADPVAENHIHKGGAYFSCMVLMGNVFALEKRKDLLKEYKNVQRLIYVLLSCASILPNEKTDYKGYIRRLLQDNLGSALHFSTPRTIFWRAWVEQPVVEKSQHPKWIRQQIARCMLDNDLDQAWLWLLTWLWVQYQRPECDLYLRLAVLYVVNTLMYLRRKLIMDGLGLTRFVGYFDERARQASGKSVGKSASWQPDPQFLTSSNKVIFQGKTDVAELKVGRPLEPGNIAAWLKIFADYNQVDAPQGMRSLSASQVLKYQALMERCHYCLHFFRFERFLNRPDAVWQEAELVQRRLQSNAGWNRAEFMYGQTHLEQRLVPRRWLRGLDVAGDENLVKTEVYAPALRWLRLGLRPMDAREPASPGMHLSIHAGEDYGHPLSGMRHVDETVIFCAMHEGDRLGHALALGILPRKWLQDHGDMILPVDEHVDNLVWAWGYAQKLSVHFPLAGQVLPILAMRIQKMLKYVSWISKAANSAAAASAQAGPGRVAEQATALYSPDILYEAWQLRANCPYQLALYEKTGLCLEKTRVAVPNLKIFEANSELSATQKEATRLYRIRWRCLKEQQNNVLPTAGVESSPHAKKSDNTNRQVRISLQTEQQRHFALNDENTHLVEDSHSEQELDFFEALQDYLLDKYDQMGLMIEANPTSNVYTALMDCYKDHPIFRWYPPDETWLQKGEKFNRFHLRRGAIKVCVNTDDPGIMPTTLRTEFALLREAALEHGVTRTNAERWLANLRAFGLQEFQQKHLPLWVPKRKYRHS